jgi:hypothetical protein
MKQPAIPVTDSILNRPKTSAHHHYYAEILASEVPLNQGQMPEPIFKGFIYTRRNLLCIEHLAKVPLDRCIKSNAPAERIIKIHLRSPKEPETWWGKCPRRLTIGLSKSKFYELRFRQAMARLGLLASLFCFWCGITINPWFCAVAVVGVLLSSLLNAISPLWYREVSREFTSVIGASPAFLAQFPHCDGGDNIPLTQPARISGPHV